jgi:hypothetical protein
VKASEQMGGIQAQLPQTLLAEHSSPNRGAFAVRAVHGWSRAFVKTGPRNLCLSRTGPIPSQCPV